MSRDPKTQPSRACAAGVGVALTAAVMLANPVFAAESDPRAIARGGVESTSALTVVRDPETGQLRAPTAEEAQALRQPAARSRTFSRAAPPVPLEKFNSNGARGARLTDEFLNSAVAVRNSEGQLAHQCFDSQEQAQTAATSPNRTAAVTTAKE